MYKERGAGCRRSARISALEEKARLLSVQEKTNKGQSGNITEPSPSTTARKRGRKRKSLLEVGVNSVGPEEGDDSQDERELFRQDDQPADPSIRKMPKKHILEFILDLLQRRDTQEIFAQPVDPNEVEGYYDLIKEPMDFGTMRAKLQEGMYTSLEQFERDVFLISSNAMEFNSSTTMFYQEAKALHDSAQKVFHNLRTEPEKFHLEYSRTRRRPGKKPLNEAADSSSKLTKPGEVGNVASDPPVDRSATVLPVQFLFNRFSGGSNSRSPSPNSRSGRGPCGTDRRMTYHPPSPPPKNVVIGNGDDMTFSFNPNALMPLASNPIPPGAYEESLKRFTKGLGPVAQKVAQKKLEELRRRQSRLENSPGNTGQNLAPAPSERVVKDLDPTNTMYENGTAGTWTTDSPSSGRAPWIPMFSSNKPSTPVPQLSGSLIKDHQLPLHSSTNARDDRMAVDATNLLSLNPNFPYSFAAKNHGPEQSGNTFIDLGPWGHPFLGKRPEASREAPNFMSLNRNFPGGRSAVNLIPAQSERSFKDMGPRTHTVPNNLHGSSSMEAANPLSLTSKFFANHTADNLAPELSADRRHGGMLSGIPNRFTVASIRSGTPRDSLLPTTSSVQELSHLNWATNGQAYQNISNASASNKGKMTSLDDGRNNFSIFNNAISNAEQGMRSHVKGGPSSPTSLGGLTVAFNGNGDEIGSTNGKTSHADKENVKELLSFLGSCDSKTPAARSSLDLDYDFPYTSPRSEPRSPSMSSSFLTNPSEGMCLPFQSEVQLDQATRKYLQELRSGCFNAIATSDAPLRYQKLSGTKLDEATDQPVEFNQPAPKAPEQTYVVPLQRPRVAPSQRVPPLNPAGLPEGATSQCRQGQSSAGQSFWDMLQASSSFRNNEDQQPDLDLQL